MTIVPIAVVELDVCVYAMTGARLGAVSFGDRDARAIVDALDGLTGVDPFSGPRCLPQTPEAALVVVADGLHVEQVLASQTGCRGVSNGFLSAPATAAWSAVLDRALMLAAACGHRFGMSARCVATAA
jgi:hypothetical protein